MYTNVSVTGTRSESMWFHDVDSEGAGSRLLMCYLKKVRSGEDLQSGPRPVTPHDIESGVHVISDGQQTRQKILVFSTDTVQQSHIVATPEQCQREA